MQNKNIKMKLLSIFSIIMIAFFTLYPPLQSQAALSGISDTMTRIKQNTLANHDMRFRVETAGLGDSNDTMVVDFDDDFAKGTTDFTDVDFFYGSSQSEVNGSCSASCTNATLAAAQGAATWGVVWDGGTARELTFTFPSSGGTAVAANDYVRILIGTNASGGDQQMTNPNNTNATLITITTKEDGSTTIDTGSIAVAVVTEDQIVYNATVDPALTVTFTGNGSAINFGTLTVGSVAAASTVTVEFDTNAANGFTATAYDAGGGGNPGLYKSSSPTDDIGSSDSAYADGPTTLAAGTEGFGLDIDDQGVGTGGTLTLGTRYNSADGVGGLEVGVSGAQTIVSATEPVDSKIIDVIARAAISGLNKAGSYTDTVTIVVTGNF